MTFVHYNGLIVNANDIASINFSNLVEKSYVVVKRIGVTEEIVKGPEAFNLVMELCPSALEGEQAKYKKHAWAIHNLIGHPLMQIFAWL